MLPSHIITYSFYEREDIIISPHFEILACACLEQVASLRSARQAHADATELDSLYSENESASKGDAAATPLAVMRPFFDMRFFHF